MSALKHLTNCAFFFQMCVFCVFKLLKAVNTFGLFLQTKQILRISLRLAVSLCPTSEL